MLRLNKIFVVIFAICFIVLMSGQILRVTQYGLYGSQKYWDKTISIPTESSSPDATALKNLINQGESEGWIKCFPEQKICHYTGKGNYDYGAFSEWEQSSDYIGWLVLIMKSALQALFLTVLISLVYVVIKRYSK